jgi:hypothetical protein
LHAIESLYFYRPISNGTPGQKQWRAFTKK